MAVTRTNTHMTDPNKYLYKEESQYDKIAMDVCIFMEWKRKMCNKMTDMVDGRCERNEDWKTSPFSHLFTWKY